MLRKSILLGLALLAAAPAFSPALAQGRGRGGNDHHDNRGGNDHRNDNRGPGNRGGNDRHDNRNDNRGGNRGNDWNRNNTWNGDWTRHNDYNRYDRNRTSLSLGFIFGSPGYSSYSPYDSYGYREPVYANAWGLYPGQCIWDREFAYWRGRPADVEVRRCADGYGNMYVVQNSARLWRYR